MSTEVLCAVCMLCGMRDSPAALKAPCVYFKMGLTWPLIEMSTRNISWEEKVACV